MRRARWAAPTFQLSRYDDPRRSLARWMTAPTIRTSPGRWSTGCGGTSSAAGIIHPIDDARSTNPPSNPELLDALARDFVASGYDVKQPDPDDCNSSAYGLSSVPNEANRGRHADASPAITPGVCRPRCCSTPSARCSTCRPFFPAGRASFPEERGPFDLPDEAVASQFSRRVRPAARESACECERATQPALRQALELVSSEEIQRKLTAAEGYAAATGEQRQPAHAENVDEIFLRVRFPPRPSGRRADGALEFLDGQKDREEAYRSLLWSLLATNEFLFNH